MTGPAPAFPPGTDPRTGTAPASTRPAASPAAGLCNR